MESGYLINHAVYPPGNHALGTPCPNRITLPDRITFPDQMQPSDTAKDVPARRNGPLGIKTRLNLDSNHAGPMREKTKVSLEHFYNNYLFTASEEKHVAQQRFIGYVT